VDALRGLTVAGMLVVNDAGDWEHVHPWFEHANWNGCTLADCIFPLFLFLVGVSIALGLAPRFAAGTPRSMLRRQALARALRLVLLGLALAAFAWLMIPDGHAYRPLGVLQRIGLAYSGGALVALYAPDGRREWMLIATLLAGYTMLLLAGGSLAPYVNVADRIDAALLGRHAYLFDAATGRARDPEGLLSTIGALATVLIGIRAGAWLRAGQRLRLWLGSVAGITLGAILVPLVPLNKQLWTPSFVLFTAGIAGLALALANELVDRHSFPAIGRSLGVNAICVYALSWVAVCLLEWSGRFESAYERLFEEPLSPPLPLWAPSLAYAASFTLAFWLLAWLCNRRGWRLTI
jgi:predicted acyltransferase